MPVTAKPARAPRSRKAVRARGEDDQRKLERIAETLEAVQKDLAAIGGSVGTGVRDLRRDVAKLLRDARRDVRKMSRAVQRDLDRLQKHVASANARPKSPASAKAKS